MYWAESLCLLCFPPPLVPHTSLQAPSHSPAPFSSSLEKRKPRVVEGIFPLADLGGSGLTAWGSTLSCPDQGPRYQDHCGSAVKSQPWQPLFSPALLPLVYNQSSGGPHSWAHGSGDPRQRRLGRAARRPSTTTLPASVQLSAPYNRSFSLAEICRSYSAGVPLLRKCSCWGGPSCGGQLCADQD